MNSTVTTLVERGSEGEKGAGNDPWGDERQYDTAEGPQRPGAEAGGGAVQVGVEAGKGGRDRDDDERRAQGGVRQDEPEVGLREAQVGVEEEHAGSGDDGPG